MRSTCIVFGDFSPYIHLMNQLLMASKLDIDKSSCSNEVERFNSAILPWKHGTMQPDAKKSCPSQNRKRLVLNLNDTQ